MFFICFRECLETSIIVSVLLSFIKQTLGPEHDSKIHKKLVRQVINNHSLVFQVILTCQVWLGVGCGLAICLCIGGGIIGAFYGLGADHWADTEDLWEGIFGLIAALIITIMGAALLRVSKLQDKWRVKIAKALEPRDRTTVLTRGGRLKLWAERYAMFMLPFVTVLREGLEAVVFIGGVSLGMPATAFPLAVFCGLLAGSFIGWLLYKYVGVYSRIGTC